MPVRSLPRLLESIADRLEADPTQAWGLLDCLFFEVHHDKLPNPNMDIVLAKLTLAAVKTMAINLPNGYWPASYGDDRSQIDNDQAFALLSAFDNDPTVQYDHKVMVVRNAARHAETISRSHLTVHTQ